MIYQDYGAYLDEIVANVSGQPADSFSPDLGKLDALIASLMIER